MIELPHAMREVLIEQIEEFVERPGTTDPEAIAEYAVTAIQSAAEELEVEDGDEIISQLEASGELEGTLDETIQEKIENDGDMDLTADDIVALIERMCEIDWTTDEDEDEDEIGAGFFDDGDGFSDDEDDDF